MLSFTAAILAMRLAPPPSVQLRQQINAAWLAGWMVCQPAAPVGLAPTIGAAAGFSGAVVPTRLPPAKATPKDAMNEVDTILLGAKRAAADQAAFAEEMWAASRMRLVDEVWALVNPIYRREPTVQLAINRRFSSGGVVPTKAPRPPVATDFRSGSVVPTKMARPPVATAEAPRPAQVATTASPAGAPPPRTSSGSSRSPALSRQYSYSMEPSVAAVQVRLNEHLLSQQAEAARSSSSWPAPTREDEFRMMFPHATRRPLTTAQTPSKRPSRGHVGGPQMSSAQSYDWRERQRAQLKAEIEALYREPAVAPAAGPMGAGAGATAAAAAAAAASPSLRYPYRARPLDDPERRQQRRKVAWRLRRRWQRQQLVWAWLYLQGWVDGTSVGGKLTNSSAGLALAEKLARSDALTAPLRRPGLATQLALAGATAGVITQLAPLARPTANIAIGGAAAFCAGALGAGAALGGAVTRTAVVVARRAGAGALTAVGVVTGAEMCARALVAAFAACAAAMATWAARVVEWAPVALEAAMRGVVVAATAASSLSSEVATRGAAAGATTAAGGAATMASASQLAASCAAAAMAWAVAALATAVVLSSRTATALLAAAAVAASAAKVAAAAVAKGAASAATAVAGGAAPVGASASQLGASLLAAAGAVGTEGGAAAATAASAAAATAAMAAPAARVFLVAAASAMGRVVAAMAAAVGAVGGATATRLWAAVAAAPVDALLLTAMAVGAIRALPSLLAAAAGDGGVRATTTALLGRANAARLGAADALSGARGALSSTASAALGRTRVALSGVGGAVAGVTSGAKASATKGAAALTEGAAAVLTARRKFVVPSLLVAAVVVISTQLALGALLASALRLLDGAAGGWPGALRIPLRITVGSG